MRKKLLSVRKPGPARPHLKRTKLSVGGKTSYEKAGRMAFPSSAAAADSSPLAGMGGGAPGVDMSGGAPPAPPPIGGGDGGPPVAPLGGAGPPAPPGGGGGL